MMKPEDIQNALGNIGDDLIEDAAHATAATKKRAFAKQKWIPIIAATLVFAILIGVFLKPEEDILSIDTPHLNSAANANSEKTRFYLAQYPASAVYPSYDLYKQNEKKYDELLAAWRKHRQEQGELFKSIDFDMSSFFQATANAMLTDLNGENAVYSPFSIYLALSLLAETTDRNSRQQILDALGVKDIETLRTQANTLWLSHYANDDNNTLILGNSLWMNGTTPHVKYVKETLQQISDNYYASSFIGDPKDNAYHQQFRDWINEQTNYLLKNDVGDLMITNPNMSENWFLTLVSTIYFKAGWSSSFSKSKTEEAIFHTEKGDVTALFMKKTANGSRYYQGALFSATSLYFKDAGYMWLILPNENIEMDDILCSAEYQDFIKDPLKKCPYEESYQISISIPKFDISCKEDELIPILQSLGITDVFEPDKADFSPIIEIKTSEFDPYVSNAKHNARVTIDEEGCEGAAYTIFESILEGSSPPPEYEKIVFKLDRPFLFAVTSQHNVPLFVGVVNDPTAS